jgi:hypothetical protein
MVTIVVVSENIAFIDSAGNHMVQGTGSINGAFRGMHCLYHMPDKTINFKTEGRPLLIYCGKLVPVHRRQPAFELKERRHLVNPAYPYKF